MTCLRQTTALAALLLAGAVVAPLSAQAASIAGYFYHDQRPKACTNADQCLITNFSTVPAGKTVVVTRVTCQVSLHKNAAPTSIMFFGWGSAGSNWEQFVAIPAKSESDYRAHYSINSDVQIVLKAGEKPSMLMKLNQASATINAQCSVTGTIS